MNKISWCKKQTKGTKLIEPNDNLSQEYFQNAEESLKVLKHIKDTQSNMWLATTKYYIEYFAVYSIFMKIGVKCEIHECTISLINYLEGDLGLRNISTRLEKDKELRIDNQYYLKNRDVEIDLDELAEFLLSVKNCLEKLDNEKIEKIRTEIDKL